MQPAKRLAPTRETIRRLFALSGNQCAFPGCTHPLIDVRGNFVAEVCHIEAAEPGGPRFNPAMTNEERRLGQNLLLMCHRHHVETDDEERFPAAELRRIKETHEAQFEEAVTRIAESTLVDVTKSLEVIEPRSLHQISTVLEWGLSQEELSITVDEMLRPLLRRVGSLAPETRSVLLVVVDRANERGTDLVCPLHEIEQVTRTSRQTIAEHVATLQRYEIGSLLIMDEVMPEVIVHAVDGWPFWRDLRTFCAKTNRGLDEFIMGLRFDLLD